MRKEPASFQFNVRVLVDLGGDSPYESEHCHLNYIQH